MELVDHFDRAISFAIEKYDYRHVTRKLSTHVNRLVRVAQLLAAHRAPQDQLITSIVANGVEGLELVDSVCDGILQVFGQDTLDVIIECRDPRDVSEIIGSFQGRVASKPVVDALCIRTATMILDQRTRRGILSELPVPDESEPLIMQSWNRESLTDWEHSHGSTGTYGHNGTNGTYGHNGSNGASAAARPVVVLAELTEHLLDGSPA